MDADTIQKINDPEFKKLAEGVLANHNPFKANIQELTLQSLGLLVVRFQQLENYVSELIRISLHDELNATEIITSQLSFKNLVSVAGAMVEKSNYTKKDQIFKALNKARQAEEIRNKLMHSSWVVGAFIKAKIKSQNKFDVIFTGYQPNEIQQIASWVDTLDSVMQALAKDYEKETESRYES